MNLKEIHPFLYFIFVVVAVANFFMWRLPFGFLFQVCYAGLSSLLVFIGAAFEIWRLSGDELDYQSMVEDLEREKR